MIHSARYIGIVLASIMSMVCNAQSATPRLIVEAHGLELITSSGQKHVEYRGYSGQRARIELVAINSNGDLGSVAIPGIDQLKIVHQEMGSSATMMVVNGAATREEKKIRGIEVILGAAGTIELGPVQIMNGQDAVLSNTLTIHIEPAMQSPARTDSKLYAELMASKQSVYEGELFLLKSVLHSAFPIAQCSLDNESLAHFEMRGNSRTTQRTEHRGGVQYQVIEALMTMVATKQGTYTIDPFVWHLAVADSASQHLGSFFQRAFGGMGFTQKDEQTNAVTLEVLPLPACAEPVVSVGNFDTVAMQVQPAQATIGELITLRLTISGSGNFDYMSLPPLVLPDGLTSYDPVVHESLEVRDGAQSGSKVYEYVLRAQKAQDLVIPSQTYTFFDPKEGKYYTRSTKQLILHITPGQHLPAESSQDQSQSVALEPAVEAKEPVVHEQDIHFIIEHPVGSRTPWAWAVSWLLFAVLFMLPLGAYFCMRSTRVMRYYGSARSWVRLLVESKRVLAAGDDVASLYSLFKTHIALCLGISPSLVDDHAIRTYLQQARWLQQDIDAFMHFLTQCEMVSFAGAECDRQAMALLFVQARMWFNRLVRGKWAKQVVSKNNEG